MCHLDWFPPRHLVKHYFGCVFESGYGFDISLCKLIAILMLVGLIQSTAGLNRTKSLTLQLKRVNAACLTVWS